MAQERTYNDFFEVDEGYYPEINPNSIKDAKNPWNKTYPHETIIKALLLMERMLARTSNENKKGLWIEGSFGTGKSRVMWLMESLLHCPPDAVTSYFSEYPELHRESDLRDRLLHDREGGIVTVTHYGSGRITSSRQLVRQVYESTTKAVKSAGYDAFIGNTLRGRFIEWLSDKSNQAWLDNQLQKTQARGYGSFAGCNYTSTGILTRLQSPQAGVDQLLDELMDFTEKINMPGLVLDIEDLQKWIETVIEKNNLRAIVFFWDEFSSFFKQNRNALDEFQKLAELANSKPFYFVIATHNADQMTSENDEGFKIVYDRFQHVNIRMPDNIAFRLIAHAIKIRPEAAEMWKKLAGALNSRIMDARHNVAKFVHVEERVLEQMLPLHPMAALLLKHIAYYFASNQRSMFNFIKNTDTDLQAFQYFIEHNSPENGTLLTIDMLWNFFYVQGKDVSGGIGRSNLDYEVASILDVYTRVKDELMHEQRRVLKTFLMMIAMSHKTGNQVELFLPTEQNIRLAFEGDDLENGRAIGVAKGLVEEKKILFIRPGDPPVYEVSAVQVDVKELEEKKDELKRSYKTTNLIASFRWESILGLGRNLQSRYQLQAAADQLAPVLNRWTNKDADLFHIRAMICVARDETDQAEIQAQLQHIQENSRYDDLVLIDATQILFGKQRFEKYIEYLANELVNRERKPALADEMKKQAEELLLAWRADIEQGDFIVYSTGPAREKISCNKLDILRETLAGITKKKYPFSFDNIKVNENLFSQNPLRKGVECGIANSSGSIYAESSIKNLLGAALTHPDTYWTVQPQLELSQLKNELDRMIQEAICSTNRIALEDVIAFLLERGFLPCALYAYLTGFLMKEYAHDPYRYAIGVDGSEGGSMTPQKMADYIDEALKQFTAPNPRYRTKYIEIMSEKQHTFLTFLSDVFQIDENLSVESAVTHMRLKLKGLGCPLWCYAASAGAPARPFIEELSKLGNTQGQTISTIAESLGSKLMADDTLLTTLKDILTESQGIASLQDFLSSFENGDLLLAAKEIGIVNPVQAVKKRIADNEAVWLWDQETGEAELRALAAEYHIMIESRSFDMEVNSFSACIQGWISKAGFLSIPYKYMVEAYPALKDFLKILRDLPQVDTMPREKQERFLYFLRAHSEEIRDALHSGATILRDRFSQKTTGFSEEDLSNLAAKLPRRSFFMDPSEFLRQLDTQIDTFKKSQLRYRLLACWEKSTGTKSPSEWSLLHQTPILVLVPTEERQNVERVLNAIEQDYTHESDTTYALEYLEKAPPFLTQMNDPKAVDAAFFSGLLPQYGSLLTDLSAVRKALMKTKIHPYKWYGDLVIQEQLGKLAEDAYYQGASAQIVEKIQRMSDQAVKDFLIRRVKANYRLGMEILGEED